MASGSSSSTRIGSVTRSFDFGADDVLCSYDDLVGLEASNGKRPGSAGAGGKDFREGRTGNLLQNVHYQQEVCNKQDMVFLVDKCMKKYVDTLLSVLEGISGRLKHLEVYCYNLEKSIGEFRSDLVHDHNDRDTRLKSLEKNLQEVHRSVQILRDKQELAETQKELAKLQLAQKESFASSAETQKEEADVSNKQLVLALPQKPVTPSPEPHNPPYKEQPAQQVVTSQPLQPPYFAQPGTFYVQQPNQVLNQTPPVPQHQPQPQPQSQLQPQLHSQSQPQLQPQLPPQTQSQPQLPPQPDARYSQQIPVQTPQQQAPLTNYQQQWSQQVPQQYPSVSQSPQQAPTSAPYQPQGPPSYPPYQSAQPGKPPGESFLGNVPMSAPYSSIPPPGAEPYGYGGPSGSMPQQPAPHSMQRLSQPPTGQTPPGQLPANKGGYMNPMPYPHHPPAQGYSNYGTDSGGRPSHAPPFYGGSYPSNSISGSQNQKPPSQAARGRPFGELMENAISMGYPRELVAGAIYRMEESGQPADFNVLLDMLNGRGPVPAQRGWSS